MISNIKNENPQNLWQQNQLFYALHWHNQTPAQSQPAGHAPEIVFWKPWAYVFCLSACLSVHTCTGAAKVLYDKVTLQTL